MRLPVFFPLWASEWSTPGPLVLNVAEAAGPPPTWRTHSRCESVVGAAGCDRGPAGAGETALRVLGPNAAEEAAMRMSDKNRLSCRASYRPQPVTLQRQGYHLAAQETLLDWLTDHVHESFWIFNSQSCGVHPQFDLHPSSIFGTEARVLWISFSVTFRNLSLTFQMKNTAVEFWNF